MMICARENSSSAWFASLNACFSVRSWGALAIAQAFRQVNLLRRNYSKAKNG